MSICLTDDVTKATVIVINCLKNHAQIENAWCFNDRVYGLTTSRKEYKFYPYKTAEYL